MICPICLNENIKNLNHFNQCRRCGHIFNDEISHLKELVYTNRESNDEYRHNKSVIISQICEYFRREQVSTFIDYGCGDGYVIEILNQEGFSGRGVEKNKEASNIGNKKPGVIIDNVDAQSFVTDPVDALICLGFLTMIKDLKETLRIILKNLKKEGFLIVTDPLYDEEKDFDSQIFKHFFSSLSINFLCAEFNLKCFSYKDRLIPGAWFGVFKKAGEY